MFGRSPFSGEDGPDRVSEPLFRSAQPAQPAAPAARSPLTPARPAEPTPAAPAAGPAASRPRSGMSVLSAAFRFEGEITGEADLQIDGQVKGDIRVARLVVGPGAKVEGAVRAHHVEVRGHVIGSIEAQAVFLYESARVDGDITPGRLSIEGGAVFEGRVQSLRGAPGAEDAATAPVATADHAAELPRLHAVESGAAEAAVTAA